MPVLLNPYVSFAGNAREAMEFYKTVFGGDLTTNTFGEYGAADEPFADQLMHARLEAENGLTLMASDTPPGVTHNPGDNITISLSGDSGDELRGYWEKLSDGGTISVPLEKQMWGDEFGQCADKFGIGWLVNIAQPEG